MKKRKDSFFGIHCDFHGKPENGLQGKTLNEDEIRDVCRTLKPDFIQIDCKGHPGWTSYPSKLGNALPEFAIDTLEVWRRVTREENVALYLHYSGVYDKKYGAAHPKETVMNADGTRALDTTRALGKYADDLLIPQISELAEKYGIDGVWIDGECWKARLDYHPDTVAAFEKETVLRQTINECLMDHVDHGIIYGILERGYTQSEIGRLVGMAQQNIGRRMKKTIPRLQQHLTAQGYAV